MIDRNKRDAAMQTLIGREGLKASVYLPTHTAFPDNRQDPIVYKNLLQEMERDLVARLPRREWQDVITSLQSLQHDVEFWNHTTQGLGVLSAGGQTETFLLDFHVPAQWLAGEHFHLLPLYPLMDSISHAYLTDISRDRFRIFEVSQDGLREFDLPEVKSSFPELFDDMDANATLRTGSYAGLVGAFHGHGGRQDQTDKDTEKYHRYLSDAFQKLNRETGYPMILAGTESSLRQYREIAHGTFYLEHAITQPLESLSLKDAMTEIKTALRPYLESRLTQLNTEISNKRNAGKAVHELDEIRDAAAQGRVDTLILPGTVQGNERALLDGACEQTILYGGTLFSDREGQLELPGGRVALLR
ncbi:MAG: hypothetical protein GX810_02410 [Clostridiales bacterium]|nr:hypothetical protein [Clostridiales bacterium]